MISSTKPYLLTPSTITADVFSPNSIATGIPAKVIISLDDYFKIRKEKSEDEAIEYAQSIVERYYRTPVPEDFWEEFPLFVSGNEVDDYPMIPIKKQLGAAYESYVLNHVAKYKDFVAFLNAAGIKS